MPTSATAPLPPRESFWNSRAMRRFRRNRLALVGFFIILALTLACFIGPHLLPFDELYIDLRARFAPPGTGAHIFGTDPLGRDIAARLFVAGQTSMLVGSPATGVSPLTRTPGSALPGCKGGRDGAGPCRRHPGRRHRRL